MTYLREYRTLKIKASFGDVRDPIDAKLNKFVTKVKKVLKKD